MDIGKEIIIDPVFDVSDTQLCPDKLNYTQLLEEIENVNTWPRGGISPLPRITADFGRSHYFFTDGKDDIAKAVHVYCFRSEGKITDDERQSFFDSLNIKGEEIPKECDEVTPTRGCIITRVKFEMLKRYFDDKGKKEISKELALLGMNLSTQDLLSWIKYLCTNSLSKSHPKLKVTWAFFQTNFTVIEGQAWMKVTMINYKPSEEAWQVKLPIPKDNKKNITAIFQINLDKGPENDYGKICIKIGKTHSKYKKRIHKTVLGIYNADTKQYMKYCDTMPTW